MAVSNLNPGNANANAIPLRIRAAQLFPALLLIVSVASGWSQASKPPTPSSQTVVATQHQALDGTDPDGGGFDTLVAERRIKLLNIERRKNLISDSDKLLKLATELNNEIAQSNSGSLTADQLRKVADIEKLAHSVRDKMTMTINPPSAAFFPNAGTQ